MLVAIWQWLIAIGSLGFLFAIYFSTKLSRETRNERYWMIFSLSAVLFAVHYWLMAAEAFGLASREDTLPGLAVSGLVGAILFGYASYGLYKSMVKVRHQLE